MYFMTLVVQALKSTTHADDIIIGMGGENQTTLGVRCGTLRMIGYLYARLTPRPARNGIPEHVVYLKVDFVGIAFFHQQVAQAVIVVIFIGQTQDGFAG